MFVRGLAVVVVVVGFCSVGSFSSAVSGKISNI